MHPLTRLALVPTLTAALGGCSALRALAGRDTVSLEGAQVTAMSVDIRKSEKTICPRERVQMAIYADAVFQGEAGPKKLETWHGDSGANRNDKLEFDEFAFHSELGQFDAEGWFSPNTDLLASAARQFEITTAYRRQPDKFTFKTSYKPDYRCITGTGASGARGEAGANGNDGTPGQDGSSGSSDGPGSPGSDGRSGGSGATGSSGGAGPKVVAYATYVKTAFYDRLIAVVMQGPERDFVLLHPDATLTLFARGGDGGPGGRGGRGGDGGRGGSGNPGGNGGKGSAGGNGAAGGNGGPGGTVELVVDARFADLAKRFEVDVSGGRGGPRGEAGEGGRAGSGGSGYGSGARGADGSAGTAGQVGSAGSNGPPGSGSVRAEDVSAHFSGLTGISMLEP